MRGWRFRREEVAVAFPAARGSPTWPLFIQVHPKAIRSESAKIEPATRDCEGQQ